MITLSESTGIGGFGLSTAEPEKKINYWKAAVLLYCILNPIIMRTTSWAEMSQNPEKLSFVWDVFSSAQTKFGKNTSL